MRKVSERAEPNVEAPALNLDEVLPLFREDRPLLVSGSRAYRYIASPPHDLDRRLVSFCSIPLKLNQRIIGMLNAYSYTRGSKFSEGQRKMLYVLASRAAVSIENARLYENLVDANKDLTRANVSLEENFKQTIIGFAHALEESDRYTRGHSERVAMYARLIAVGLRMSGREIDTVVKVGLMHDVGKIGVRNDKLNKPGKLTPEELAMFRSHPAKGKRILEPIPFMRDIVPGCYCHHEAWDGSGYPQGSDGRPHPADRPHRRDRRRLRRDDLRPRLPQGAAPRDRVRRAGTLRGLAVRSGDRPGVPVPDRRVPEDRGHGGPLHPALGSHPRSRAWWRRRRRWPFPANCPPRR